MMMLFASKRKKGTEAATGALRPLIALAQQSGGVSNYMFASPYVLGFMQMVAAFYAKEATSNRISPTNLGFALQDSFAAVSNINGAELVKRATENAESGNSEAMRGFDDAAIYCYYTQGVLKNEDSNQLVTDSEKLADMMRGALGSTAEHRSLVAGAMLHLTFLKEIVQIQKGRD